MTAAAPLSLDQMKQRRAELASDLAEATTTLADAREALISSSTKPQTVTDAQAALNALEGALHTADERIDKLTEAEAQRMAEAYRQGLLDQLVQGAGQATGHRQAFTTQLHEALKTVMPLLEDAFAHLHALHDLREQWVPTLRELDSAPPTSGTALALVSAQIDLKAIRMKPLPGSWHHDLGYPYVSAADELTPELLALWACYFALAKAGVLPGGKLTGIVSSPSQA